MLITAALYGRRRVVAGAAWRGRRPNAAVSARSSGTTSTRLGGERTRQQRADLVGTAGDHDLHGVVWSTSGSGWIASLAARRNPRPELRPNCASGVLPGMSTNPNLPSPDDLRANVRARYGRIPATTATTASSCCGPVATGCCGPAPTATTAQAIAERLGYAAGSSDAVPDGSNLGLGCGNPLGIQSLRPGQTVLDLGSGAGFDAFLAGRAVGPTGRVIGVDMTPEMIAAARQNAAKAALAHVEFRLGEIEHLPVADASVDVVLSNCVINLSPEKGQVFREAFRVLRPGGRLAISDIVAMAELRPEVRADLELHAGCVAGAATIPELEGLLTAAGFQDVRIAPKAELQAVVDGWFPNHGVAGQVASANITATKPLA
jgi:arsenite methyltransferase